MGDPQGPYWERLNFCVGNRTTRSERVRSQEKRQLHHRAAPPGADRHSDLAAGARERQVFSFFRARIHNLCLQAAFHPRNIPEYDRHRSLFRSESYRDHPSPRHLKEVDVSLPARGLDAMRFEDPFLALQQPKQRTVIQVLPVDPLARQQRMVVSGEGGHREDPEMEVALEEGVRIGPEVLLFGGPAQDGPPNAHQGREVQGRSAIGELIEEPVGLPKQVDPLVVIIDEDDLPRPVHNRSELV